MTLADMTARFALGSETSLDKNKAINERSQVEPDPLDSSRVSNTCRRIILCLAALIVLGLSRPGPYLHNNAGQKFLVRHPVVIWNSEKAMIHR